MNPRILGSPVECEGGYMVELIGGAWMRARSGDVFRSVHGGVYLIP